MTTNSSIHDNTAKRAESESFNASAFSISLTVKDLAASLAWYHDVLGFPIDRKIEREGKLRSVALKAGTHESRSTRMTEPRDGLGSKEKDSR